MTGREFMKLSSVFTAALLVTTAAFAANVKPAVVYDLGGKFDRSFNEGVFNGATKFKRDSGVDFRDLEIQSDAQREQALRKFAKDGFSPIMTVGFAWATALDKIAGEFPSTKFAIIDMVVDKPNVQSIVFKEHEGSFLVGVLAAKTSKTGKVGFVGGMDIPLISKFECGYAQGVRYINAKAEVFADMAGTDLHAWNDPIKGGELAKSQINRGADIVYAAAGATGQGVLKAAADAGKLGIGVDSNQDNLFPGKMLTSMLKRVDIATYKSFLDAKNGVWKPGIVVLGVKEGGVDYAEDEWNKSLLTSSAKAAVEAVKADIISGNIRVHDYSSDNACPRFAEVTQSAAPSPVIAPPAVVATAPEVVATLPKVPVAPGDRRVALVIGNADYRNAVLANPTYDADLVSESLEKVGFEVTEVKNADFAKFDDSLTQFVNKENHADIALFYFAGHGFAVPGDDMRPRNYLMSTSADMQAASDAALRRDGLSIDEIINRISKSAKVTLAFVDACRNDPFHRGAGDRGFQPIIDPMPRQIYIGMSTQLGRTALDGVDGKGSPFAQAFARKMTTPGLRIDDAFRALRSEVSRITDGKQQPEILQDDLEQGAVVLVKFQ